MTSLLHGITFPRRSFPNAVQESRGRSLRGPFKPAYRIDHLNPSSTGTPVYICFEAERDRDEDEEKLYLYYIILATDVKLCLEDDHTSQHGHKAVWALLMGPLLASS